MTARRALGLVAPLAGYLAAVVALWQPLAAHIGTHLPNANWACGFDTLALAWILARESHALVAGPWALADGGIYHPTAHSLFYGETAAGALPFFLPTFLTSGNPTLALNVTVLVPLALTAWTLHLVVRRWTGSGAAGVAAAATFLLTPWTQGGFVACAPSYALLQYFPLIILLAAEPHGRRRDLAMLVLLVLQGLSNPYVGAAVIGPLVLLGLARTLRASTRRAGGRLLAVVAVALVVLTAAHAGQLLVRAANPGLGEQTPWHGALVRQRTRLPQGLFAVDAATAVPPAAFVLIAAGAVAAVAARRRATPAEARAWRHGAFWTLIGVLMSLTPAVLWHGRAVALPVLSTLERLGFYDALRVPRRLGVAALMGLAVLAGLALEACARRLPLPPRAARAVLATTVVAALYASHARSGVLPAPQPLALAIAADTPVVRLLEASDGPVLELPVAVNGVRIPAWHAQAMYRAIFHRRPLVNGYHGYWPAAFPGRMALAAALPDPIALATLRRETGLTTVVVHTDSLPPEQRVRWLGVRDNPERSGLRLAGEAGPDWVFAVVDSPIEVPAP